MKQKRQRRDFTDELDNSGQNNGSQLEWEKENKRLGKENKRLLMEREILKKAATFFASESN